MLVITQAAVSESLLIFASLSAWPKYCRAYATTTFATEAPAKAIAFALPTRSGIRPTCPPLLRLGRRSVRLQLTDPADTAERGQDG
jgi:hypothetical protein